MFPAIRSELGTRHLAIKQWYSFAATAPPPASVVSKGLVFVQNYAVYEYCVVSGLNAALTRAQTHSLPLNEVRPELLALILASDFESASNSGSATRWSRRVEMFQRSRSSQPVASGFEGTFPTDGSHFRPAQLETIWEILGISAPIVPEARYLGRITEMVEHRNAIAHGRDSAESIGRRFSNTDIQERIADTEKLCAYIVDTLELHCDAPSNLRG